jgi:dTDP-glucose 4,6-dehydratase
MRVLVTGGAGFIGSHVVRYLLRQGHDVCVATRHTYAAHFRNLAAALPHIDLLIGDLAEPWHAAQCAAWQPDWVVHAAAETHVDRAIADPGCFVRANVLGTAQLLQALQEQAGGVQRVLVYSTDEVYGPAPPGVAFDEEAPLQPSNAYSASKVGAEAVARAFWVTHGLPVVLVRPCNTYGPGQHPEKVLPKFVAQCLAGQPMTVYNDGQGSRDWLHVDDHARAVLTLLSHGQPGAVYNLAAESEHTDEVLATLVWNELASAHTARRTAITYVPGRPGHDRRYRMTGERLRRLGWEPRIPFARGVVETIRWQVAHPDWWTHDVVQGRSVDGRVTTADDADLSAVPGGALCGVAQITTLGQRAGASPNGR